MEQSGKNKFYLRLSFYTILCTIIYAVLVIFLYSNHLLLRNRVNIIISFIIIILVSFSIFQSVVTKIKGNKVKLIVTIIVFLIIFASTLLGNKYIIDNYLSKEDLKEYNGEQYLIMQKDKETYYYKIYSDFLRGSAPKYSMSEMSFVDGDVKYIATTIVEFDKNGSVLKTTTDSRTESGE